jgi:hypothetical protein
LGALDIFPLCLLVASHQENDYLSTASAEVHPVTGSKIQTGLQNAFANILMVAQVAALKSQNPRLNPRAHCHVKLGKPCPERNVTDGVDVLKNPEGHSLFLSYKISAANLELRVRSNEKLLLAATAGALASMRTLWLGRRFITPFGRGGRLAYPA